ncbi:phosphoglycerate mutase family protein [Penicillium odoratum]|uniref:phosphoglycerate mutase family protein n=1 Tax=Penicillium odoratum TaxID=1167516 RepID=UPI00254746F1|nr:phosphoglycerate mutase family protein [Penicillium odoratum]KAJ5746729.1 phosphoglycerate mutase family protein [Penicillium odoratum]
MKDKASSFDELFASAASYEAAKALGERDDKPSREKAKEFMAAWAGAFIDRQVEVQGNDWVDKEKIKDQARQNIENGGEDW